jgi:serine/threonine protein kinase
LLLLKFKLGFFVACVVLALEYLHIKTQVIHRDLKPENLVLDSQGYAYLTDLGIARKLRPDNASDTSGTPGYMAPEVMCPEITELQPTISP